MKTFAILFFAQLIAFTTAVFTDYCTPGLCKHQGGDGSHTGCRNNVPHDGKFQSKCPADAVIIEITKDLQKLIIDEHNTQRNHVAGGGLRPLRSACRIGAIEWDEELKLTAELHVKECLFAHDKCRNTLKYPFSGQNIGQTIYAKTKKLNVTLNIIRFMTDWYNEYVDVKQDVIDSFIRYPSPPMIGHFLTTVNERNCRIGCAAVNFEVDAAKTNFMLTCNYPSTSITKSTIYNSCKVPGSGCQSGKHPQYSNLCSTREVYDMSGLLKFIPYDGNDDDDDEKDKETDKNDKKDKDREKIDGNEKDNKKDKDKEKIDDKEKDNKKDKDRETINGNEKDDDVETEDYYDYENFPINSIPFSLQKRSIKIIVIFTYISLFTSFILL